MQQREINTPAKRGYLGLISVMFAFFAMGVIDIIGIASNYIKKDFGVSDTMIGTLSFILFTSFLLLSVPTSGLMNRIGQRKTVILSIIVMCIALSVLYFSYNITGVVLFYILLGVGITMIQVGFSPLVASVIDKRYLSSALTFGQFTKALGSALIPLFAIWASLNTSSWNTILPYVIALSLLVIALLFITPIKEDEPKKALGLLSTLALLKIPFLLFAFWAMICHVGIDVGMAISSPRLLVERTGCTVEESTFTNTIYFICRTAGCFIGTFCLSVMSNRKFYIISMLMTIAGVVGLFFATSTMMLYFFIGMVAIGNSNVFPIMVSKCMMNYPDNKNEVSAIMVMGLFGGGIIPLIMGISSDAIQTQTGGVMVLFVSALIMASWTFMLKEKK